MELICHRINKIADLNLLDSQYGCEIDLRSNVNRPNEIHLSHDPWVLGDRFEDWIRLYKEKNMKGHLILNTKEDGLEKRALEIIGHYKIDSYFFLDTTLPTLVKWTMSNNDSHFAIRVSKFETTELAKKIKGKARWIWLDCFAGEIPSLDWINEVKDDFQICLVSPELQGEKKEKIFEFKNLYNHIDAVCTKYPELWKQ